MAEITTGLELEISNSGLTFTNPNDAQVKLRAGSADEKLYLGDNSVAGNVVATKSDIDLAITLDKANYVVLTNNDKVITTSAAITLAKLNTLSDINTNETIQSQLNSKSPNAGNVNLVTVGTISTGIWQGSVIDTTYGGTGATSLADITVGRSTADAAGNDIISTYATRVALENVAKGKVHYAGHVDTAANLPINLTDTSVGTIYSVDDTQMDYMWVTLGGSGTSTDPYIYGWDQLGSLYKAGSGISLSTITTSGNEKYITVSNSGVRSVTTGTSTNGSVSVNTGGTSSDVQVKGWSLKADLDGPTFTGVPKAPTANVGTNTTQVATTAFVKAEIDSVLQASDAMRYKGTLGTGGTITVLPNSHSCGDTYKVITAGTYAGVKCEVGDMIICVKDGTTASNSDWTVVQSNIDGAVTGPASAVSGNIAVFDGATGKVIKDSGKSTTSFSSSSHKHSFTGTSATISSSYTPSGSISTPTFTGTTATISSSYTPAGTISKPTFTGSKASISVSMTPAGTVSAPTFTGTEGSIGISYTPTGSISVTPSIELSTDTVNSISSVGSAPSLTGSYNSSTKTLSVSWNAGSVPSYTAVTVATGVSSASASGSFTGNATTLSTNFTPAGTVSAPTFTGTAGTGTGEITPSGTVSTPTFTGTAGTATASYTPAGSVSAPTFTGSAGTASATYTPAGSISTPN